MEKDTSLVTIYREQTACGEERTLSLREHKSRWELIEHTAGPDTQLVFGDPAHTSVLRLDGQAEERLCVALGEQGLVDALRRLLAPREDPWLSDVQDALDRLDVPYARLSFGPSGASYVPCYFDA